MLKTIPVAEVAVSAFMEYQTEKGAREILDAHLKALLQGKFYEKAFELIRKLHADHDVERRLYELFVSKLERFESSGWSSPSASELIKQISVVLVDLGNPDALHVLDDGLG